VVAVAKHEYAIRVRQLDVMVRCDEPLQPEQIDDIMRTAFGDVEYRDRDSGAFVESWPDGLDWEVVDA
jgi:hypothetical protein